MKRNELLKKVSTLAITGAILGSTLAFSAQADWPSFKYQPRPREQVEADLIQLAEKDVHVFSRRIFLYNYFPRKPDDTGYQPPISAWATQRINRAIHHSIWNPDIRTTVMNYSDWYGQGIYAAADPMISSNYGSPEGGMGEKSNTYPTWNMIQIALPVGSRYWDVTASVALPKELQKELRKGYKCDAVTMADLMKMNRPEDANCRKFGLAVISAHGIDALGYKWGSARPRFKKNFCPTSRPMAFYLTTKIPFTQDHIRHFTNTLPPEGTQDEAHDNRLWIEEIFRISGQSVESRRWPSLDSQRPRTPTKTIVKRHFFSCGGYPEDRRGPQKISVIPVRESEQPTLSPVETIDEELLTPVIPNEAFRPELEIQDYVDEELLRPMIPNEAFRPELEIQDYVDEELLRPMIPNEAFRPENAQYELPGEREGAPEEVDAENEAELDAEITEA